MQRYAHWLTPIITLGVAAYIIVFLVDINQGDPLPEIGPVYAVSNTDRNQNQNYNGWSGALAKHERQGYFYPVNEIYVEIDLNQRLINEKTYRLSAKLRDPYQLFCLKQELQDHGLPYTMSRDKQGMSLLVYSKQRKPLVALVESLKNYQITASFLPYQEDQKWKNIQ